MGSRGDACILERFQVAAILEFGAMTKIVDPLWHRSDFIVLYTAILFRAVEGLNVAYFSVCRMPPELSSYPSQSSWAANTLFG